MNEQSPTERPSPAGTHPTDVPGEGLEQPRPGVDTGESGVPQPSPSKQPRGRRNPLLDPVPWLVFALSIGLDQLTKALVVENLLRGESWPEDGFFRFTHAWNTGTAFSLFQDQSTILTFVSFVAVIALYFVYRSVESPTIWVRFSFGLLLGGAFGNLLDRIRLGHVTDFIDVGPWPIFNIADSSIVVGMFVLFVFFWNNPEQYEDKKKKRDEQQGANRAAAGAGDERQDAG